MTKELFIIRGLPGAGKSTLAKKLNPDRHHEADQFFVSQDGTYRYDSKQISEAHVWCQSETERSMRYGFERIVVSNTFTQRWQMKPYHLLALKYGYQVTEISLVGKLHPNVHNVSQEKINEMREKWEN